MLAQTFTFTDTGDVTALMVHPIDPNVQTMDYLKFTSLHFRYWRGSIKFLLSFYTSVFISARFKISVMFSSGGAPDPNDGDIVSEIIDVKGDTHHEVTIPYLWPTLWRPVTPVGIINYPYLFIEPISPIVGSSVVTDPLVYLVVWRAAGEDFQLNQVVPFRSPTEGIEKIVSHSASMHSAGAEKTIHKSVDKVATCQMDPRAIFKRTFRPIINGCSFTKEFGVVSGEQVTSLKDLIRRYVTNHDASFSTYPVPDLNGPYHSLSRMFKYWRGSRRIKVGILQVDTPANNFNALFPSAYPPTVPISTDAGVGTTVTFADKWPWLEAEIPWYSTLPFVPTVFSSTPVTINGDYPSDIFYDTDNGTITFVSAGDDFCYGYLIAPEAS
jgi:hypothetical protein